MMLLINKAFDQGGCRSIEMLISEVVDYRGC